MFTCQGRRKVWKSGDASIIRWAQSAPLGWNRVNWPDKIGGCLAPPSSHPGTCMPAIFQNQWRNHQTKIAQKTLHIKRIKLLTTKAIVELIFFLDRRRWLCCSPVFLFFRFLLFNCSTVSVMVRLLQAGKGVIRRVDLWLNNLIFESMAVKK